MEYEVVFVALRLIGVLLGVFLAVSRLLRIERTGGDGSREGVRERADNSEAGDTPRDLGAGVS